MPEVPPRLDPDARIRASGTLASLHSPQFRWLYASNLAFFFAVSGQSIVRAWIAFQLTDSAFALGLVSSAVGIPMLVLSPLGGVLADRVERRNLIVAGQAVVLASEGLLLLLILSGELRFWQLLGLSAVMGCVFPLVMPARQVIVVNVVGRHGLGNAMGLNMAALNATRIVGPAAAGFLIPVVGVEGTYGVNLVLYAVGLAAMLPVHRSRPVALATRPTVGSDLLDGVRYVFDHRLVGILLAFGLIPMFLTMPFQTLLVVFAEDVWHVGSPGLGMLNAAAGSGGVVGSIYVASRDASGGRLALMLGSMVAYGVFLVLFAASPWFAAALGLIFLANGFASVYGTLNNTAIQLLIPDRVRGRIQSFLMMSFSLPLLGTLPVSALAEGFGAPRAVASASLLAVVVAFAFYAASPALRSLDANVRRSLED